MVDLGSWDSCESHEGPVPEDLANQLRGRVLYREPIIVIYGNPQRVRGIPSVELSDTDAPADFCDMDAPARRRQPFVLVNHSLEDPHGDYERIPFHCEFEWVQLLATADIDFSK